MKRIIVFFIIFLFFIGFPLPLHADIQCSDRYLVLVNPVRSRELWFNKSLKPIEDQYKIISDNTFKATWLIQYDTLEDKDLLNTLKNFNQQQELGLLMEISPALAKDANVLYHLHYPWASPNVVFLSGYEHQERKLLIDKVFKTFKDKFGHYPVSVGAWWIDSYSLSYMKAKYNIKTVLIVADQRSTDHYGIWGQWWGVPYYPSKMNLLTPASNNDNKLGVVVIQWAQRDFEKAYGDGLAFSNYSVQANDYIDRGLNTEYFKKLVNQYLDCNIPLGQVTVGLETGMESTSFIAEYTRQLEYLKTLTNVESVTMADFYNKYSQKYPATVEFLTLQDTNNTWNLSPQYRENKYLGDYIKYDNSLPFSDYLIADKDTFLDRRLPIISTPYKDYSSIVLLLVVLTLSIYSYKKSQLKILVLSCIFSLTFFLPVFKSGLSNHWYVFFIPVVRNLLLIKVLIIVFDFWFISFCEYLLKKMKVKIVNNFPTLILAIIISPGIDYFFSLLRYTNLNGRYYLGVLLNTYKLMAITYKPSSDLSFKIVSLDFHEAASLIYYDYLKIWHLSLISLVIFPLLHIILGVVLYFICRRLRVKYSYPLIIVILVLFIFYLINLLGAPPKNVVAFY
jgi:hypothetical protein